MRKAAAPVVADGRVMPDGELVGAMFLSSYDDELL
jgi:hypothetical protein